MELIIVAGVAKNGVIGNKGKLPWHIKEDLQHFKKLTFGHPVIMGKTTYDSIVEMLGKPLPGRKNIVLTKNNFEHDEAVVCHSISEAIDRAGKSSDKAFIIGGQSIYKQTIDLADKLEITKVNKDYEGDAFFPEIDMEKWEEISREDIDGKGISFLTFKKKKKGLFIVFEGIDGSGKTTQMKKFADYLFSKDKYNHVVLTRNPYKNKNIRKVIVCDNNPLTESKLLAEMFINDRKNQTSKVIVPNINEGHFVISDRYKLSTIAYQSAQGLEMDELIKMHNTAEFLVPDMTFIIDISPDIAFERMKKEDVSIRGKEHKFEANIGFSKILRDNYIKAKELLKDEKIFIVNGEGEIEKVFNEIKEIFERKFYKC